MENFKKLGAEVLAVSVDSQYSHSAWINGTLGKINYPLASDMTKKVSRDYEVLDEEKGIANRGLFIIDPESNVKYSVIHDLGVGRNTDEIIRVLKALKTSGLCPVNWNEGDELLG